MTQDFFTKQILFMFLLTGLVPSLSHSQGFRSQNGKAPNTGEIIEVPVKHGFIQKQGFDSNDDVVFFVDTVKPSGCYKPIETPAVRVGTENGVTTYEYRQYMEKITDGPCAQKELLRPENAHLMFQQPYRKEIFLREIKKEGIGGNFRIRYRSEIDPTQPEKFNRVREFSVDQATQTTIDELLYANVSSVYAPDILEPGEIFTITLSGVLPNTCVDLEEEDIEVRLLEDVLVARPILKVLTRGPCLQVIRPFVIKKIVKDVKINPGRFLLHVRSKDGHWFNLPFSAI